MLQDYILRISTSFIKKTLNDRQNWYSVRSMSTDELFRIKIRVETKRNNTPFIGYGLHLMIFFRFFLHVHILLRSKNHQKHVHKHVHRCKSNLSFCYFSWAYCFTVRSCNSTFGTQFQGLADESVLSVSSPFTRQTWR